MLTQVLGIILESLLFLTLLIQSVISFYVIYYENISQICSNFTTSNVGALFQATIIAYLNCWNGFQTDFSFHSLSLPYALSILCLNNQNYNFTKQIHSYHYPLFKSKQPYLAFQCNLNTIFINMIPTWSCAIFLPPVSSLYPVLQPYQPSFKQDLLCLRDFVEDAVSPSLYTALFLTLHMAHSFILQALS
jgi:hypothetical protein